MRSLKERSLQLVRVTAEDARDSKTHFLMAQRFGRFSPILREGEYVAVSDRGLAYHLTKGSVSHENREIKAFMSALDQKPMPSLREAQNAVEEKRQREIAAAETGGLEPPRSRTVLRDTLRITGRTARKIVGMPFVFVANAFESLFSTSTSPEERELGAVLEHERKIAVERAERQRGGYDHGR